MRVRVRWWWFVLAFVGILILCIPVGLSLLREHNLAAYEADGKVLADLGYVMSWDEVEFPKMDADLQARWKAWGQGVDSVQGPLQSWWYTPTLPAPEGVEELLAERRRTLAVGLECLRAGVVAGMTADLSRYASIADPLSEIQGDGLLALRELATLCRAEALLAEDPTQALADADLLVQALHQPLSVIDLMILSVVAEIRDDAWLTAVRSKRVHREQAAAWLQEDVDWMSCCRRAWMSERLWTTWATSFLSSESPLNPAGWYRDAITPVELNRLRHDLAVMESTLGSHPPPSPARGIILHQPIMTRIAIPNLRETQHAIAQQATTGRIKRLAARLHLDHQDGQAWPISEVEIRSRYGSDILHADDASTGFRYGLDPGRVPVLRADPSQPPRILPPPHRNPSLSLTEP